MHQRPLGATGLLVSEIGMGCNRLGEPGPPPEHWVALVRRAVERGVNVFDSSESYNWGASESVLGKALRGHDKVLVATKVSRPGPGREPDFSSARLQQAAEASLQRLGRDRIDIYKLHSPSRQDMQRFDWREGMARLKRRGDIRLIGVAVNSAEDAVWLIEQGAVDVLQITYNILHVQARERLFDLAAKAGVGLMGRLPLAQGVLSGKFEAGRPVPEGHRALLAGQEKAARRIELAEQLKPIAAVYPDGMARMAMHFALTPAAISCLIPGARTIEQLEANVGASNGRGLDERTAEQIEQVRAMWPQQQGWY